MSNVAWSALAAAGWMAANLWAIQGLCRLVLQARTPRRRWRLAWQLAVKFPLLYGAGYLIVTRWQLSAVGLAAGMTLVLAALLIAGLRPARLRHG